jgi:plasmid stabilization system protein ParE
MKARISARAQRDLELIFARICVQQNEKAAERFLALTRKSVEFVAEHPLAGPHPRWATRHRTIRFWVISRTNFLIYYFANEQSVSIERILDGRRDVARIMERGVEDAPG